MAASQAMSGGTGLRSELRSWYAALLDVERRPATVLALGDSLIALGSLRPAVDRLVAHYGPRPLDTYITGYGWTGGEWFDGDGTVAEVGGFDGRPRLLGEGERCRIERWGSDHAQIFGSGPVEISVDGDTVGLAELAPGEPAVLGPETLRNDPSSIEVRALGEVSLSGAFVGVGNASRGIRYYEIGMPGKTTRFLLDHTEALANVPAVQPDVIVLDMAINDLCQGSVASFRRDIDELARRLRDDVADTGIVYWMPHRPRAIGADAWRELGEAVASVCERYRIVLVDGHELMGSTGPGDDTYGLTKDGVHYTEVGKRLCSEALLAVLAPGLQFAPRTITSATLDLGQIPVGAGGGEVAAVGPPERLSVLHGTSPNLLAPSGLFFSEALHLGSGEPPAPPAPGTIALFARTNGAGAIEVCVRFPGGEVAVLATGPLGPAESQPGRDSA